jgi:hypothetical protein
VEEEDSPPFNLMCPPSAVEPPAPPVIIIFPPIVPALFDPPERAMSLPVVDVDDPPTIKIGPREAVVNSILPEEPQEEVPDTNCKTPLVPPSPAFTVLILIDPDDDDTPELEISETAPPVSAFAVPLITFILPPANWFDTPLLK